MSPQCSAIFMGAILRDALRQVICYPPYLRAAALFENI